MMTGMGCYGYWCNVKMFMTEGINCCYGIHVSIMRIVLLSYSMVNISSIAMVMKTCMSGG